MGSIPGISNHLLDQTGDGHVNKQDMLQSSIWVGFEPTIFGSTGRRFTDWANSPPLNLEQQKEEDGKYK